MPSFFCEEKNYFFSFFSILVSVVVVVVLVAAVSAGFAAAAVIVSAGGGVAGAAGAVVAADSVVAEVALESLELLPQEVTKRPKERASTLNFTNFIIFFLDGYAHLYRKQNKVTLP